MDIRPIKLLELLSVNDQSERPQIIVRLNFEKCVDLVWELDQSTADQLATIIHDSHEKYKYRLSLLSFWDANHLQYYSSLTKTFRDQSEKIYFSCSEYYVDKLRSIKDLNSLKELQVTATTNKSLSSEIPSKPFITKRLRTSIAIASLAFSLLAGFSSYSYLNQTVFAKNIPDHEAPSMIYYNVVRTEPNRIETPKPEKVEPMLDSMDNMNTETVEPKFPSVELDKVKNYRIPAGFVALTFDDGPSKYTNAIVDILIEYNVGGTFFFIGNRVKKFPNYVDYVHNHGFAIGNHSTNHAEFTKLSLAEQENNIIETNELIEHITNQPVELFRPPYGANNEHTSDVMVTHGMKMVLWNSDTEDWKSKNAKEILKYVTTKKSSGAIILLHETDETVKALPEIIEYLQDQGLQIVNLK